MDKYKTDRYNQENTGRARQLRKNMTEQERKLWYKYLRYQPLPVNRQKTIGAYIVDFYCASAKLVIEIDGSQHFTYEGENYDKKRDEYLKSLGLTILRYSNLDIDKDFDNVCRDIWVHMNQHP